MWARTDQTVCISQRFAIIEPQVYNYNLHVVNVPILSIHRYNVSILALCDRIVTYPSILLVRKNHDGCEPKREKLLDVNPRSQTPIIRLHRADRCFGAAYERNEDEDIIDTEPSLDPYPSIQSQCDSDDDECDEYAVDDE